jgi:hypothetical protein
MTLADLRRIFDELGWRDYEIIPRLQILDSSHEAVVPLSAPTDTQAYDPEIHAPKHPVRFDRPVFSQFDIFVRLNPRLDDAAWQAILDSEQEPGLSPAGDSVGLFVRSESTFHLKYWTGESWARRFLQYGAAGAGLLPFVGDFDGDGMDGVGVYDPAHGAFFLKNNPVEGPGDEIVMFGPANGYPVAGDWTGSGTDTIGVYVPSAGRFFVRHSNAPGPSDFDFSFGPAGKTWIPLVGDWHGDGRDSIGLYDPDGGFFYLKRSISGGEGDLIVGYGGPNALPVAGDWDDDGRDTIGVYLPSSGEFLLRNTNGAGEADQIVALGVQNGMPVAGRWSPPTARRRRSRT